MFKRVKAEPNGNVTFEYGCSTVTVDKNGVSHIRSTLYKKGKGCKVWLLYGCIYMNC